MTQIKDISSCNSEVQRTCLIIQTFISFSPKQLIRNQLMKFAFLGFLTLLSFQISATPYSEAAKTAYLKQSGDKREVVIRTFNSQTQSYDEKVISDSSIQTYHPDISPLGNEVAYTRGTIIPGSLVQVEIVIKNLETSVTEIWTPKANQYIHSEFSGDARYLVFSGPNPKTQKQNIGIIDLLEERKKGPVKTINQNNQVERIYNPIISWIDSEYHCYAPAVSSQGKMIIYHRTLDNTTKNSPKELIRFDVATHSKKIISPEEGHAMFPSLSSDDRYVTYVSKQANQWDIHLYDLWLEETKQITFDAEVEYTPVFAPDDSIYFTRFEEDQSRGNFEIGIFHLEKNDIFNPNRNTRPSAFINQSGIAEYVPSFSGLNHIQTGTLPSFPAPERSSFGAIDHQGKVYIMGGHQGPEHTYPKESFLKRVDIYDQKTMKWSQGADMNLAKHGFQMVAHEGSIYVFGGFAYSPDHNPGWKSLDTIERYDIATNTWEILSTKLPSPRSSNIAVKVQDQVFLMGGWDSTPQYDGDKEGRFHADIDVFDLKTGAVKTLATKLKQPLRRAFNATVYEGEIYMMGGISQGASHFDWIDNVTKFNPKTHAFTEITKLPYATFAPGVGVLGNKLYLIGGMVLRNKTTYDLDYVDDLYEFNPATKKWSHIGKYLGENKGFPQIVNLSDRSLGILGGHTYIQDTTGRTIDHPVASFDTLELK